MRELLASAGKGGMVARYIKWNFRVAVFVSEEAEKAVPMVANAEAQTSTTVALLNDFIR
jgi:hypothetical protein